ncbi:RNA-directed DNA polymerase [Niabella sp. 22666]|uniref:RNA-directed DNA polymerase n=1 Tax=Niabella sp. 22666 TaxID=3453954 RepID=UPI003F84DF23
MKRIGNIYERVCSMENLQLANAIAQMGKQKQYGVKSFNKNADANLLALHEMLVNKTYSVPAYSIITIYEPKEREIYRLPYMHRIVHHAIMNVIQPYLTAMLTADNYACIPGRGVHKAGEAIKAALRNKPNTKYCLKLDIKKFYPSINNAILKQLLRRKFKDADFLWLMDVIIDSAPGLPIGNYLSQWLSTFYLTWFDHWVKEEKKVQYYFRYVDDIAIFSCDKAHLHQLRKDIGKYLGEFLKLELKGNWQVFPITNKIALDMLGYLYYRDYTLLRKRNKKSFARAVKRNKGVASIAAHMGWAKHANTKHLIKKLFKDDEQFFRFEHTAQLQQFPGQ